MHPVKEVLKKTKLNQKDLSKKMSITEPTLSYRINHYSIGSIDHAIEIAKQNGINRFFFYTNGYKVSVTIEK